jgi:hypothetical protein
MVIAGPEILVSTHYKWSWFVSRVSSAPAHIRIFKGTGWSVFNLFSTLLSTMAHHYALQPIHFCSHTLCIYAHIQASVSFNTIIFKHALLRNPRCHGTCSLHSIPRCFCSCPVCSSCFNSQGSSDECYHPSRESQQHARASIGPAASSSFLKDALKSVGTSVALSVGGEALKHFLGGGNNTRRDIESPLSALRFDGFPLPISNNGDSNSSPTTPGDGSPASLDRRAPGLEEANEGVGSLDHSR